MRSPHLKREAARLLLCLLILCAPAWSQGIFEIEVQPSSLNWFTVAQGDVAIALFRQGDRTCYAISRDGGLTAATARVQRPQLRLHFGTFDPLTSTPDVPAHLRAKAANRLFIVQYETQGLSSYRQTLELMGAEVLQYMPWQGNLVRMDPAMVASVRALGFVRWVGPFHPAYRSDRITLAKEQAGTLTRRRWNIHVTRKGLEEKQEVASFIRSLGGEPAAFISPHGYLLQADLTPGQFVALLHHDKVLFVDPWSAPENDLDIARQLGGADAIEMIEGYSGEGVRAQVQDSGLETSHPDFVTPALIHNGNSSNTSHGTSVYGIVFGTGLNNPQARGFLPDAQPVFAAYSALGDRYVSTGELLQEPYRCVFETNSWGSARTFFYTTVSADMDNILFDHDIVVLQSQSNAGNQDSRPQAWAKNIISVGGIRHYDTLTTSDDAWAGSASIGPADDGRIKPDISAFYDATLAANSAGGYSNFGGTSGATPITAGHVGLIHQMWADGIFGNSLVSWDVFDNKPHATTAKALLINSATQYPFSGTGHDLTRVHQGWGRPDVGSLYNLRDRLQWIDQSIVLAPMSQATLTYVVQAGEPEFRATMVYPDPPGNPAASVHRINDLTLKVTDPMGTVYWGNNGLLANNYSTSGGSANTVDTVEQVLLQNPMAGTWTVEVIATEINQDGHVETPAVDADFSLIVSGVQGPPAPTPDTGQANQVDGSLKVVDSLNLNGQKPKVGVPGPFFAQLPPGGELAFTVEGNPNIPFQLLLGPLGRGNEAFPGIGNLDVGLVGPGVYTDIQILMNGVTPLSFLDLLANTGPNGSKFFSFSLPPFVLGTIGTLQAVLFDPNPANIRLSAATEVTIN